ncbi:aldose 1-epimerase family protein [Methylocapsa sp. S129]|uniref:aldose 1-epimerase family protein n=1 Tax=Methylocapsa sp. S129 TaxID=1641869 RepID=UPI00131EBC46|nr:aldose 1-epimerase family protein [Methylocapsa sp. S129]
MTTANVVTLSHGEASAEIALAGAEARAWRVNGRDLLWPGDPATWSQISPILFPVVGWTRDGARVDGRQYALGLHGFAAAQTFALEAQSANAARLTLSDNAETRAVYPFAFRLTVDYRLGESALEIAIEVENKDQVAMPYACGLHPGFRWPFADGPHEGCEIQFEKPERPEVPVLVPGGLISARTRPIPIDGSALKLNDELFAHDALCFINPASRWLRFVEPGGAAIELALGGFPHFALWMRPGGPFLCLEAWTGYSDPEGFASELQEKPGMRSLASGEIARHSATYSFIPA